MCAKELYIIVVLSGLAASGVLQVGGMRVYTSGEVEAVNGTDLRLKCTFDSSAVINPNLVTISWNFKPLTGKPTLRIFFYHIKPYPPNEGIFKKRISWAGDIMGSDASIIIREVEFKYNGTYTCQVTNPPDVHGQVGEIRLRVVKTASFNELLYLVLYIGGGIAVVVFFLIIIVSCRRCKREYRQRQLESDEEAPRKVRKDPTAW